MKLIEIVIDHMAATSEIVSIFERTIPEFSNIHKCSFKEDGQWTIIEFVHTGKNYTDQTLSFKLDKSKDGFILNLADVYVPGVMRGKGFLFETLKAIRKVKGLSGTCRIHVGMNQEKWKSLISRAGFEWVQA